MGGCPPSLVNRAQLFPHVNLPACDTKQPTDISLEAFKARLDVAVGSLVWWLATLHIAGGWNRVSIVVLFNPGHSMIL